MNAIWSRFLTWTAALLVVVPLVVAATGGMGDDLPATVIRAALIFLSSVVVLTIVDRLIQSRSRRT